jgi:hypothetical protein
MQKRRLKRLKQKGLSLKYILSFLLVTFLCADTGGPLYSKNTAKLFKEEQETVTTGVNKEISTAVAANSGSPGNHSSDIMIVDPKVVSQDWQNAFNALKLKKLNNIIFVLKDNSQLSEVSDVEVLPGGYLMLFSLKTVLGEKYRIVKTSDISSITSK